MNNKEQKLLAKSPDWEMRWFMFKTELGEKVDDVFRAFWRILPNKIKYHINRFDMWIETGMIEIGHERIEQAERIAAQDGKWTFRTRQMKYKAEMLVFRSTVSVHPIPSSLRNKECICLYKKRMTKSERQAHIELWEQSGQSKKAYCDQMGIRYGTFISWFRQISGEVPCGNFIDLGKTSSSTVEVLLPNGIRLYYTNSFTKNHLKELMDV